eukprot:TRINITY_DN3128_c0_g1_i1.p1 TRINITY_DN3128_c0_g1~~TRINITY_DN3128_c0_g1_i1.p1  ORF type:complete len:468 (+),score=57.46 TRINITY_DN3128_c0_g1_i1:89-1492(+)
MSDSQKKRGLWLVRPIFLLLVLPWICRSCFLTSTFIGLPLPTFSEQRAKHRLFKQTPRSARHQGIEVGQKLRGQVFLIERHTARVRLQGVELPGFLHKSQVGLSYEPFRFDQININEGDTLEVKVMEVMRHGIQLTLLDDFLEHGTPLLAKVVEIKEHGAVLKLKGQKLPGWMFREYFIQDLRDMRQSGLEVGNILDVKVVQYQSHRIEVCAKEVIEKGGSMPSLWNHRKGVTKLEPQEIEHVVKPGQLLNGTVTSIERRWATLEFNIYGVLAKGRLQQNQFPDEAARADMRNSGLEVNGMLEVRVMHANSTFIEATRLLDWKVPGTLLKGRVTSLLKRGALLDLEGETQRKGWLEWKYTSDDIEKNRVEVGSELDVKVMDYGVNEIRVASINCLITGTRLRGRVTEIHPHGAFLRFKNQPYIAWLAHAKNRGLDVGELVDVKVTALNEEKLRLVVKEDEAVYADGN